jgi:hypothetical protein
MTHISKHDTEKEWEGYTCENTRINFLVSWDTIGINDLLEDSSEFIDSEQTRWSDSMLMNNLESRNLYVLILLLNALNIF